MQNQESKDQYDKYLGIKKQKPVDPELEMEKVRIVQEIHRKAELERQIREENKVRDAEKQKWIE